MFGSDSNPNQKWPDMIDDLRATLTRLSQPNGHPLEISDKVNDVVPFLTQIRTNADAERDAFGFLPESAYESAAQAGHLFVALRWNNGDAHLMGIFCSEAVFLISAYISFMLQKTSGRRGLRVR